MSALEYTSLPMNTEQIKIDDVGQNDRGAYDRAIMVAREARRLGLWDGQETIVVHDPYTTYAGLDRGRTLTAKRLDGGALFVELADDDEKMPQLSEPDPDNALVVPAESTGLALTTPGALTQNPAAVYIASLAAGSRATMVGALNTIAHLLGVPEHYEPRPDLRRTSDGDPVYEDLTFLHMDWAALRFQHTAAIRQALAERYAPATANKMLSALRRVLYHAWKLGHMSNEDMARACDLEPVKGRTLPAGRHLEDGEIAALSAACTADTSPAGVRDAAIIGLMAASGLRRASVVSLMVEDYDRETGELRVLKAKGNVDNEVFAVNGAQSALEDWLSLRGDAPGPLFLPVSQTGKIVHQDAPMTPQAVYSILKRRGKEAGVRNFSPHDLRRTLAGNLLDRGADISTVQQILGHANVSTTQRYDRRPKEAKRKAQQLVHFPYQRRARLIDLLGSE